MYFMMEHGIEKILTIDDDDSAIVRCFSILPNDLTQSLGYIF